MNLTDKIKTSQRIIEHYNEAKSIVGKDNVIYLALQGSQNYNLEYENSDIDSKAILVPTLRDVVQNRKPTSTTHVCENDEHIDLKDIRLMFDCFKKQNINFIEILFTDFFYCAPDYDDLITDLRSNAQSIAMYNPYRAIKCIKGMALEKFHALKHPYPAKMYEIETFGYDPKQLSHLIRLKDFLDKYIRGRAYEECLIVDDREYIINVKKGCYSLAKAEEIAEKYLNYITARADSVCERMSPEPNEQVGKILDDIQYAIVERALKKCLK